MSLAIGKMAKQIRIKYIIKQDGTVTEEVIGATSDDCLKLTESVENRLGDIDTRSFKSEFYQNKQQDVTFQHNQNQT